VAQHQVLVIGLPRTGKTTFLAAMWDVVDTENVSGSLILERLDGDQKYLNEIRDKWAKCEEMPRTRLTGDKVVTMHLQDRSTNLRASMFFPDLDGEGFENQWLDRECSGAHAAIAKASSSAMLFIHPKKVKDNKLISEARPLIAAASAQHDQPQSPPQAPTAAAGMPSAIPAGLPKEDEIPARPTYSPTQVQLVELLQFFRIQTEHLPQIHLAVIVSAWDIARKVASTPEKWISSQLPMLEQFLRANQEEIVSKIFGVSAQGGDLEKDAQKLLGKNSPSERIIVAEASGQSSDITIPIRWLMERINGAPVTTG
jgi:Double-GTPase 1